MSPEGGDEGTDSPPHPREQTRLVQHGELLDGLAPQAGGRSHQSLIFSGPQGIGKATAAYALAKRLLGGDSGGGAGLFGDAPPGSGGADEGEARLVAANSHPDLLALEPEEGKASRTITVDQVRKIAQFLAHSPARGGWRMVVVDSLDAVNFNGANAMLKTLEEPPSHSVIVLVNHQTGPVLPTIRSRCREVRFQPLAFDDARELVAGAFPDAGADWVDTATVLAAGAPGKAHLFALAGVVDLYAETCRLIADTSASAADIEALAGQWGAGGGANITRRQSARLVFDRLLSMAVRKAAGMGEGSPGAKLDVEEAATGRMAGASDAEALAAMHQGMVRDLDEAERLNTDQAVVFFNLLDRFASAR